MHFSYCPVCGTRCILRQMGDDGAVPYCEPCKMPLFDMFSTCVLSVVTNSQGELCLIRQSYGDTERFVGVAGYMKPGETAEEAAMREIREEIGVQPDSAEFVFSRWHAKRGQLMLCFHAFTQQTAFHCSGEVSEARWFSPDEAERMVREGSIIAELTHAVCTKKYRYEESIKHEKKDLQSAAKFVII